jgi:methyl-accepting chemotaxis protein
MDARFDSMDARFDSMDARFDSMDARFDSMGAKVNSVSAKVDSIDTTLGSVLMSLDETRQIAKLGLEAVQGLRESNDKAHAEMRRDHDKQTDLLKSVLVHVRKRVERVERPKPRRRS